MAPKHISWRDVGERDAKDGKPYRPPEHYSSRMSYRQGYESVQPILEDETSGASA